MYARNPNELEAIVLILATVLTVNRTAQDAWAKLTSPYRVGCAAADMDSLGWDLTVNLLKELLKNLGLTESLPCTVPE
jgi:hypothetical protein